MIDIAIYPSGECRQASDETKTVVQGVRPIFALFDALLVRGLECTVVIHGSYAHTELGHRMQGPGQPILGIKKEAGFDQ